MNTETIRETMLRVHAARRLQMKLAIVRCLLWLVVLALALAGGVMLQRHHDKAIYAEAYTQGVTDVLNRDGSICVDIIRELRKRHGTAL